MREDYKKLYERIKGQGIELFVDLTKMSARYVSDSVQQKDTSEAEHNLEKALTQIKGSGDIKAHDFAIGLVTYLFENRTK